MSRYFLLLMIIPVWTFADFDATQSPHGDFKAECSLCHTTADWTVDHTKAGYDHDKTAFPLSGAHTQVKCRDCHTDLSFKTGGTSCVLCHTDYHQGRMGRDCEYCHTAGIWEDRRKVKENHARLTFPLTGAHAVIDCEACHKTDSRQQFANTSTDCYSCHRENYLATRNPDHVLAQFDTDCRRCHGDMAVGWEGPEYEHTAFPLTGGHAGLECTACHTEQVQGTPSECYACHRDDYQNAREPDHAAGQYPRDCTLCHNTKAWQPSHYDHNQTGFPLAGAHRTLNCTQCHPGNQYAGTASDCYTCHTDDYANARDPDHAANQFDKDCLSCHNQTAWEPATFDHNQTAFPLAGAHARIDCNACHENGYTALAADCWDCHDDEYAQTAEPDHALAQFDQNCLTCHTQNAWKPSSFDHASSGYTLNGAHALLQCSACHQAGFAGTPSDCNACHQDDYQNVHEPDHAAAQYPHDCTLCHQENTWKPALFDHNRTAFPLEGSHRTLDCTQCHSGNQYAGTPSDCYTCHLDDYAETREPDHAMGQFDQNCLTCHTQNAWKPSSFDHASSGYTLNGAHALLQCSACHQTGFAGTPSDCYTCHTDDYQNVREPDHGAGKYPPDCTLCHQENTWKPAHFDHNQTSFPLTGAHAVLTCTECHQNNQYAGTAPDCYTCHTTDYSGTTDPNHTLGQFDHNCLTCHAQTAWKPSSFSHAQTGYALQGVHNGLACAACHADGFANTPQDCWGCHNTDYSRVKDPDHAAGRFDHQCLDCHSQTVWSPATFNHSQTGFPLTGAHGPLACQACHTSGYTNTPKDCFFCHEDDYDRTRNPNHRSAGFPQNCLECHNTTRWSGATFNHDSRYFPIYSGRHRGQWDDCSDCHTNSSNYGTFSCLNCHEHRRSRMDDKHDDESGYSYSSAACYRCHPRGYAEDD